MHRRAFLSAAVAGPLAAAAAPAVTNKRIAAVVTVYRPNSHADVVIGKYLEGYTQDNQGPRPDSRVVSMFTAQVPKNDLSRSMAARYNVPIYRTIHEALTLGTGKLAVDGVLLIGEHGDYPVNDKGQTLYPRFELFLEIADVFRQSPPLGARFSTTNTSRSATSRRSGWWRSRVS